MLEDSKEFKGSSQDPFCTSFSKNAIIEDSSAVKRAHKAILDELIDDAVLELCFEIHRTAKLGLPIQDKITQNIGKVESLNIVCPLCQKTKGTYKYTGHLAHCLGIETHRECSKKVKNFKDLDYDSNDSEPSCATKKKSKRNKKDSRRTKSGKSLSKTLPDSSMDMSLDEKRTFFNQRCGVIAKRTKKFCMNSHNCSVHTEEERRYIRDHLLRDASDELANNGQIDIDTVDEEIDMPSYLADDGSIAAIPAYTGGS